MIMDKLTSFLAHYHFHIAMHIICIQCKIKSVGFTYCIIAYILFQMCNRFMKQVNTLKEGTEACVSVCRGEILIEMQNKFHIVQFASFVDKLHIFQREELLSSHCVIVFRHSLVMTRYNILITTDLLFNLSLVTIYILF